MPSSSRDMNIPVLTTLGVIATILIFVLIVATQAWFRYEFNAEYERKVLSRPNQAVIEAHAQQTARLQDRRWVNQQQGIARIPIDDAMRMTIRMYQDRGQPAAQPQ